MINRVSARYLARIASDRVVYTGVFLTPMARQKLLKAFPPTHPKTVAHHVTLWFYEDSTPMGELPWGKTVPLKVVGYAEDDRAQAVTVALPAGMKAAGGRLPHITLSLAQGVSPVYSNKLVKRGTEAPKGLPTVKGVVGWYDGTKVRTERP
jgi:hypothetical protein